MIKIIKSLLFKNVLLICLIYLLMFMVMILILMAMDFYLLACAAFIVIVLFIFYQTQRIKRFVVNFKDYFKNDQIKPFYMLNSILVFEDVIISCEADFKFIKISNIKKIVYSDSVFERIKRIEQASKYLTLHNEHYFIQLQFTNLDQAQAYVDYFKTVNENIELLNIRKNKNMDFDGLFSLDINTKY